MKPVVKIRYTALAASETAFEARSLVEHCRQESKHSDPAVARERKHALSFISEHAVHVDYGTDAWHYIRLELAVDAIVAGSMHVDGEDCLPLRVPSQHHLNICPVDEGWMNSTATAMKMMTQRITCTGLGWYGRLSLT